MPKLLAFEGDGDQILVAVRTPDDEVEAIGRLDETIERVGKSMADVFAMIEEVARGFYDTLKTAPVESAEVELGLQVTGKGRLYIVRARLRQPSGSSSRSNRLRPQAGDWETAPCPGSRRLPTRRWPRL